MRDFDAIKKNEMSSIENRIRHIYNVGYEDCLKDQQKVKDEAYKQGLEDAFECCKRIIKLSPDMQEDIFNMSGDHFIFDAYSADEAIDIIKRYDDKHNCIERCCKNCKHSENGMVGNSKRCEACYYDRVARANTLFEPMETDNSKIEVGDEVKRADIDKSLVIIKFTEEGWALGMNEEGNILDVKLSVYKKTGKHFNQIAEVFNSLKGDIDA